MYFSDHHPRGWKTLSGKLLNCWSQIHSQERRGNREASKLMQTQNKVKKKTIHFIWENLISSVRHPVLVWLSSHRTPQDCAMMAVRWWWWAHRVRVGWDRLPRTSSLTESCHPPSPAMGWYSARRRIRLLYFSSIRRDFSLLCSVCCFD